MRNDVKCAGSMQENKDFVLEEVVKPEEWRNRGGMDFITAT